jgi:hypothetical protein
MTSRAYIEQTEIFEARSDRRSCCRPSLAPTPLSTAIRSGLSTPGDPARPFDMGTKSAVRSGPRRSAKLKRAKRRTGLPVRLGTSACSAFRDPRNRPVPSATRLMPDRYLEVRCLLRPEDGSRMLVINWGRSPHVQRREEVSCSAAFFMLAQNAEKNLRAS